MKRCTTCTQYKQFVDFHKDKRSSDGRLHECKECRNSRTREHHKRHYAQNREACKESTRKWKSAKRERFNDWKNTLQCHLCPENNSCCLDFHHLDPLTKESGVAKAIEHWSWDRLMLEVEKCVVLCSNCHRKVHAGILQL